MMISTWLDRLFHRHTPPSGTQVAQRLKLILAHDRAALTPKMFDDLRQEIMSVVSKYVEIDEQALDIRLESDRRCTAVIANLPIRALREDEPATAPMMNTGELLSSEFVAQNDKDKPPLTPVVITVMPEPKPATEMPDTTALVEEFAVGLDDSPILNEPAILPESTGEIIVVAATLESITSEDLTSGDVSGGEQLQLDLGDGNIGDEQLQLDLGGDSDPVPNSESSPSQSQEPASSNDGDPHHDEAPTYKPD